VLHKYVNNTDVFVAVFEDKNGSDFKCIVSLPNEMVPKYELLLPRYVGKSFI